MENNEKITRDDIYVSTCRSGGNRIEVKIYPDISVCRSEEHQRELKRNYTIDYDGFDEEDSEYIEEMIEEHTDEYLAEMGIMVKKCCWKGCFSFKNRRIIE